ncbi:hypothetical protein NUH88_14570 [Nisaea acidiphila]|uniref:Uncharacterized protein n=1 Tax=Nisaea acidiphila TaxID=1862145 RepID=A0A9J7AN89_9PROT|nr:hypothetical protein [Nisaea acidiphila]UUX48630.1 hypothetical protein NUH88_14570 [Nisaea acidiphila]
MRAASLLLAGGMLVLAMVGPAPAATIREGAAAVLERAESRETALGTLIFYDPEADLAGGEGGQPYGAGDREWAESCLAIYDLYRQLGGEKPDGRLHFRRDGGRFFIAVSGAPGRWFDSRDAALSDLLRLLLIRSGTVAESLTSAARSASPNASLAALSSALDRVLLDEISPVILSPGEVRTLQFDDADIAVGTKGLKVRTDSGESGGVSAAVSPASIGTGSRQFVLGFREGRYFRPVSEREVTVRDGMAREAATADEPVQTAAVPLQDGVTAAIASSGEIMRYTVPVSEGGQISVTSTGPSDVEAVLWASDGTVVARDDDGGDGYNFALEADLEAGSYTLEVRHCCAGTGPFGLTVSQQ